MASLKDIRTRINSVKSTQKITNAMKLVSAAKFARANQTVRNSRPYREKLGKMVSQLVASLDDTTVSSYLKLNDTGKVLVVLVSTDRGLCGPLNTNLFKEFSRLATEFSDKNQKFEVMAWGRKANDFLKNLPYPVRENREKVLEKPSVESASFFANRLIELFNADETFQSIQVVYPKFRSVLEQTPTKVQLLPVELKHHSEVDEVLVEPGLETMIDDLLIRQIRAEIFQILVEAGASEHGARMTAMDAATNNAREVIKKLTLKYNRARQAAITTELTEIISGAEALN